MLFHYGKMHSEQEAAQIQQRELLQEDEMKRFDNLLGKLDDAKGDLAEEFENAWRKYRPFRTDDWREFRGAFGETVLHLVCMTRSNEDNGHRREVLDELFPKLMARGMPLLHHTYTLEPYVGENLLHMVVANSDIEMVKTVLQHIQTMPYHIRYLDQPASGKFFRHLVSSPMEPENLRDSFVTPLTVALLAPQDDDVALTLVEMLVRAGASTEFRDAEQVVHSTVMHILAKCRWNHGTDFQGRHGAGGFISIQRLVRLFDLLTSGEKFPAVKLHTKDRHGNNALQLAAIIGNGEFLKCFIRHHCCTMWEWGQTVDMRFPLDGIDSGGPANDDASVLELLAIHKHKKTMSYGLFVAILEDKWTKFGYNLLLWRYMIMTLVTILITVATAFSNSVPGQIRQVSCITALVISSVLVLYIGVMFVMRCRSAWFSRLHWMPLRERDFEGSIWGLGVINDFIVLSLSAVVCTLHIWQGSLVKNNRTTLVEITDEISSVLVFLAWWRLLKYMRLFQVTGVMVGAIPKIFAKDVLPFALVLLILTIGSAGALRVATAHTIGHDDQILGSFVRTFASLEESLHGSDVNWRSTVEGRPLIAVIVFLLFLWVATIVLFNILIAMFTSTFQQVRESHMEEHNLKWSGEMITQEKFIPVWLWNRLKLRTGAPLRSGNYGTHTHAFSPGLQHRTITIDEEQPDDANASPIGNTANTHSETSLLLGKMEVESHWLAMEQDANNETWGKQVSTWKVWQ